jgi:hypothetical protein
MTDKGVPSKEERCGRWMPNAKEYCPLPLGHNWRCRTREAMARYYAANIKRRGAQVAANRARVNAYKLSQGCVDCGYNRAAVALDFDHNDPSLKLANVSSLLWKPWDKVLLEIEKCVIICACCHRIKTDALDESQNRRRPATSDADDGPATRLRTTSQVASATVHLAPPP